MKKFIVAVSAITALSLLAPSISFAVSTHPNEVGGEPRFTQAVVVQDSLYWRNSTFNASNLDAATPINHAWWCGSWFCAGHPPDPAEGYGNSWDQWLMWDNSVDEPSLPVTVRVRARLNHDSELVYDVLYLDAEKASGWQTLASWDGIGVGLDVEETVGLQPGDYTGEGDRVRLRFRFVSDAAWSDEDELYLSAGAAQIDLIQVYFDQGAGFVQMGPTETCEPGQPTSWVPVAEGWWPAHVPNAEVLALKVYPNPFNPQTAIEYLLPTAQWVSVAVYDLLGYRVALLENGWRDRGPQRLSWDGRDSQGRAAASGSYIVRLQTRDAIQARKVLLVR